MTAVIPPHGAPPMHCIAHRSLLPSTRCLVIILWSSSSSTTLNELRSEVSELQTAVPLRKGLPSKMEGLSRHQSHTRRLRSPSPPHTCNHTHLVAVSSSLEAEPLSSTVPPQEPAIVVPSNTSEASHDTWEQPLARMISVFEESGSCSRPLSFSPQAYLDGVILFVHL